MSAMANTTPTVTTVTKTATKNKTPNGAETASRINILDFCEEHYEDILSVMDKILRDKQREVHTRLYFGENSRKSRRIREDSQNSSAKTLFARYRNPSERPQTRDRLRNNDGNVFGRDHPRSRDRFQGIEESYGNTYSSYRTGDRYRYHSHGTWRSSSMKKEGIVNSRYLECRRVAPVKEDTGSQRDPEDHVKIFQAATQQKKYVKGPVEIHNIKQKDGETIKDFIERFKVEIGRMKGAPKCMRIYGFMHGVNNPKLKKCLNEHVPKTLEEMMTATADFIRTILTPTECTTITTTPKYHAKKAEARHENFKVAIHLDFSDQEITIGGTEYHNQLSSIDSIFEKDIPMQTEKTRAGPREHQGNPRRGKKLVEAGILREVYYHGWLSKLVMVKKHDGSLRMCVDFTYLNKACPQDCYPLPKIDWKVEFLCGYPFKCFLDAYKGYHQIQMVEQDEENITFHTNHGVYCYTKMPFGLKNAGATYQQLIDKAFDRQVGRNLEIYVDDLVIKSHTETEMLRDIEKINMKLNPKNIRSEQQKDVSRIHAEKSLSLFKTLKKCIKKSDIHWMPDAEQAFKQLKQHLARLPMLGHSPDNGLFCEPSAAGSRAKLYPNGNASPGVILRSQKVTQILSGASHRGEHNITYRPRTSVKGQILADFLVEKPDDAPPDTSVIKTLQEPWTLFTDGSSCVDGSSVGMILTSPEGIEFTYALRFQFTASNNEAEDLRRQGRKYGQVLVKVLKEKSIQEKEVATVVEEEGPTWMTPIMEYLKDGTLLGDKKKASKLRIKARPYELLEEVLYRRSFLKPWLRCIGPLQVDNVIREIHKGSCSMHAGPRSVVAKAMRLGYYWPTMHRDTRDMIRTCNACQVHRPGKVKFLIVAMDYFTKWIEVKAVATIIGNQVKKFMWDNIVCRFGLPREIVLDNERADRSLSEGIKSSHGDTPFSLTYGTEAVIPVEIEMPTYRNAVVDAVHNNEELQLNLDLLEERRECAANHEANAKLKITKYYNTKVSGVTFRPRDFVYRSNEASHAMDGRKLGPKRKDPMRSSKPSEMKHTG
uniref:Reverse transcriptase domain-containing protein n=1 Tax=Tanacetum cinerariifolium TaxID=118510 RepID=A0A6L2MWD4_TANCI|nr:hypothetical protein [Tanacetum cinerariifolium]